MSSTHPQRGRAARLAQHLRQAIQAGEHPAGAKLPPSREIADQHGVSLNTAQKAYRQLEREGWIGCVARQGAFVKRVPPASNGGPAARQIGVVGPAYPGMPEEGKVPLWSTSILAAAEQVFAQQGFQVLSVPYFPSRADTLEALLAAIDRDADRLAGMVLQPTYMFPGGGAPVLQRLDEHRIPWVVMNRWSRLEQHNFVAVDTYGATLHLGRSFARLGFDRVLVLDRYPGPSEVPSQFLAGFVDGFTESRSLEGVKVRRCPDYYESTGFLATQQHLEAFGPPQGILTYGDTQALGAIRACQQAGLRVPDDVAVVGGTGLPTSAHTHPALTVLAQPIARFGVALAEMLLEMIGSGAMRGFGRVLPCEVLYRESFNPPAEARPDLPGTACVEQSLHPSV